MRLLHVRKAYIPKSDRDLFERYDAPIIGAILAGGFNPRALELQPVYNDDDLRGHAAAWLTDQFDRKERKENWSLVMEAAITLLVAVELFLSSLTFFNISAPSILRSWPAIFRH